MLPSSRFDIGAKVPGSRLVNVLVETPAGSRAKYKFLEASGLFLLHKMLPAGAAFPFDFGFIPGTRADDGDPLDVLLVGEERALQGCLVTTRLLGVIDAEQRRKGERLRNDRLIGVPETEKIRPRSRTLNDLPPGLLDQIEHFFTSYNHAEGREFVPLGRHGPAVAARRVEQGIRDHRAANGRSPRARASRG
jgi:inorganic pyrophosphatase